MIRHPICCAISLVSCLSVLPLAAAQIAPQPSSGAAAQPQPGPSLDDELLKDLEAELGADETTTPPADKPGSRPVSDAARKPGEPSGNPLRSTDDLLDDEALDNALLRELRSDSAEDDDAPLSKIGRAMRQVEELVSQAKSGQPTQQLQDKIVVDLDRLLEAARQRQKQSKSSASQQSSSRQPAGKQSSPGKSGGAADQPAQDSTDSLRDRTAARPDPDEMKNLLRELWGHLPEHERQMVINSTIERFLPKYELLIEAYFRRLAEEAGQK